VSLLALALIVLGLAGCSLLQPASEPARDSDAASTEPATGEEIREIQTLLADRGYDPGPIDGMMGPRTAAAIREYEKEADLEPTGEATHGLLARLRDTATGPGRRPPKRDTAPRESSPVAVDSPSYRTGDTYVYTGEVSYTVLRVGTDRVTWRDAQGDTFTAPIDVGLPQIEWKNGAWKGRNETRQDRSGDWPPPDATEVAFDVRSEEWNLDDGADAERSITDARWTCRNEGTRQTTVPAGEFEATVIACERSPAPAGLWQRRVWYYAPAIGHFVRREDRDSAGIETESIELVAAIPGTDGWPPAVRAGLKSAMEAALNEKAVGEETAWSSTAVNEEFAIRVIAESKTVSGQTCRNYVILRMAPNVRHSYPAIACRAPDGRKWSTPGFDGEVIGLAPRDATSG